MHAAAFVLAGTAAAGVVALECCHGTGYVELTVARLHARSEAGGRRTLQ